MYGERYAKPSLLSWPFGGEVEQTHYLKVFHAVRGDGGVCSFEAAQLRKWDRARRFPASTEFSAIGKGHEPRL